MSCRPRSRQKTRRAWPAAVLLVAVLGVPGCDDNGQRPAAAPSTTTTTTERSSAADRPATRGGGDFGRIPEVVRNVEPSVVAVLTGGGEGSGVVYRADGVVVTNHHVVAPPAPIEVGFADGKRLPARLVASDPLSDLAVLKVDRNDIPPGRFATELPVVGELAIAIGNPLGFENTVTAGIISGLHRAIPGAAREAPALVDLIQTDAATSNDRRVPGMSPSGGCAESAGGRPRCPPAAWLPWIAQAAGG